MMLQIGGFYAYYLKGSVIPFISINDCSKTLKEGMILNVEVHKHIKIIQAINQEQERLSQALEKIQLLKKAFIQTCFKESKNKISA